MIMLPLEPNFEVLAKTGGEIAMRADPHPICGGFFFGSGAIDRVADYETGLAGHHTFRGEVGEPDPLIMDERFVAACVRGRGVTVLSACSHAGIVNACLSAKKHFPDSAGRFCQEVCKNDQAAFLVGSVLVRTAIPSLNNFPS